MLLRGPNCYTMFAAWLGVLKAGGVVVATMPLLRPGEIATVIDRAQISHAIVDSRFIGDFRQAMDQTRFVKHLVKYDGDHGKGDLETRCADLEPLPPLDTGRDDPALIAFTSGTTGVPKGCVHFHRDILAPCDSFAKHLIGPKPGDIFLTSAPIAFTFGLGATLLFPLRFGAAAATIEQGGPPLVLEAIAKFGVTHLATAPTAYKAMLSQPALDAALKTLRYCISAGEHLPEATWHAWQDRTGIAITDGIGATEMMHIFVSAAGDDIRPGATGKAVPGYEATVLDAADQPMAEGEGRLAIKGPTGCRYLDDPRQRDYVANGWNVTGDTYRRDADGYLLVPRAQRRHDRQLGLQHRRAGSGERAAGAPRGRRMRGDRRAVRGARAEGESVRRAGRISRASATSSPTSSRPSSRTRSPPTNIRAKSSSSRRCPRPRRASSGGANCGSSDGAS